MKVGIAYSLAPLAGSTPTDGPDDQFEEFDSPATVAAIADVIRGEGHEVTLLGDGREFLARVLADPPEFVFNIAEGAGVGRCREARVPAALEMLGIPYSGSDPLTLAASLDKDMARKLVMIEADVACPVAWCLPTDQRGGERLLLSVIFGDSGKDASRDEGSRPPRSFLMKPALEGSSKGIRGRCVAETLDEATAIYDSLLRDYRQPVVVEEFIAGDEVTVGVVADVHLASLGRLRCLPMRILPKRPTDRFVYSLEVKRDWQNQVFYEAPPLLPDAIIANLEVAALEVFRTLGCRDLARIDFRVRDGVAYFIEANPLPGLAPVTSDLVIAAEGHGIDHADLIRRIFRAALIRVGLA